MCNSCVCFTFLLIVSSCVLIGIFHAYAMTRISDITDVSKCPYCYGKSFCADIDSVYLDSSFFGKIVNWLNTKNVYYGDIDNVDVVVKKLASDMELSNFDDSVCVSMSLEKGCDLKAIDDDNHNYTASILGLLMHTETNLLKPFQVCSREAAEELYLDIIDLKPPTLYIGEYLKYVWTILKINVEPIILQLLKSEDGWPFPKYYGSCGRTITEENRGVLLLDRNSDRWMNRAYFALQLLYAAGNLTEAHPKYRFYLTDISPDNIAIDDKLTLTFIDLENMIVQRKKQSGREKIHISKNIDDEDGFAYSSEEVCNHDISDHNYYAICKLILSKNAPYPMPKNGLLNTPPQRIVLKYPQLFQLIEECTNNEDSSRMDVAHKIIDVLQEILKIDKTVYD